MTMSRSPSLSRSANAVPHERGDRWALRRPSRARRPRTRPDRGPDRGGEVLGEVGDEDVGMAIGRHVADRDAHAGLGRAVRVECAPRPGAHLLEDPAALVPIEVVRVGVVRHVDIDVAVFVYVGRPHGEAESQRPILEPGLGGGVDVLPALEAEEVIGRPLEPERAERDLFEPAPTQRRRRREHAVERAVDVPARDTHRGRHRRASKNAAPVFQPGDSMPTRAATSSKRPLPRLRNRRFRPKVVTRMSGHPSLS